jgi:hypothetical protein
MQPQKLQDSPGVHIAEHGSAANYLLPDGSIARQAA